MVSIDKIGKNLMTLISFVMINDTIKKYENKERHKIYVETLVGKNHGQRRKFHYQFERELQNAVHKE